VGLTRNPGGNAGVSCYFRQSQVICAASLETNLFFMECRHDIFVRAVNLLEKFTFCSYHAHARKLVYIRYVLTMEITLKKLLLASLVGISMGTAAQAADLPRKSVPVLASPVPMFTWTGFYVGLNAGYGFGDGNTTTIGTSAFQTLIAPGFVPGSLKTKPDGFIGGGQIGYNAQFGAFVAGIEADIQFADMKKTANFIGPAVLGTQLNTSTRSELEYFGTLRGRLGFTPFDRFLVYATGGLAYGQVKTTSGVVGVQAPGLVWAGSNSDMKFGWTLGAGIEYALTNNLTVKGEYLYYDLGKSTVSALGNPAVRGVAALNGIDYVSRTENRGSIVRAGLNYKF
jgi:outer membrane immunogenic protein